LDYLLLKHFHMGCAAFSGSFFLLRGCWMLSGSPQVQRRWVKRLPHLVDTLLLASALGLAGWSHQYPGQFPWLTAKVAALVAYIVLGSVALKYGRSRGIRAAAFVAALATFGYIVTVATTRNPLFFLPG
jgi:uncharacterized membrane protein SirB2